MTTTTTSILNFYVHMVMWPAGIKWQAIPCWLLNMCWTNLRTGGQNNSAWATQDYPPYCAPTTKGRRSALQLSRTQRSWRSRPPREPPRSPRQAATARHQALPAEMGPEPTHRTAVGAARGGWPSAAARNAPPVECRPGHTEQVIVSKPLEASCQREDTCRK